MSINGPFNNPLYRRGNDRVNHITPFTYRDGISLLELIEELRTYVTRAAIPSLNKIFAELEKELEENYNDDMKNIGNVINGYNDTIEQFIEDTNNLISTINNSYVPNPVQNVLLNKSDTSIEVPVSIPTNVIINYRIIQDSVGGRNVSLESRIAGDLVLNTSPNSVTMFDLIPNQENDGWIVSQTLNNFDVTFNVKDYGAVGDGITDDRAAIQQAIWDSEGRGIVIVPEGEYYLGFAVRMVEGLHIIGTNATFTRNMRGGGLFYNMPDGDMTTGAYDSNSNIIVEGITFDAKGHINGGAANSMTFNHCKNIVVRDCTFLRTAGAHGLELNAVDGARVENCRFLGHIDTNIGNFREGIQIDAAVPGDFGAPDGYGCQNIIIDGCYFGSYGSMRGPLVGIGSHSRPTVGNQKFTNIVISNCTFDNLPTRGINAEHWENATLFNNTINGFGNSLQGIRSLGCIDLNVQNNRVNNVTTHGFGLNQTERGVISGNTISTANEGIYSGTSNNVVLSENNINNTRSYGITVDASNDTLVSGNKMHGVNTVGNVVSAIRLTGVSQRTSVTGNQVRQGTNGKSTYGVSIQGPGTGGNWLFANDFYTIENVVQSNGANVNSDPNRTL